ncbi:MAG: SsrA-binding protein SmpB [Elusimicrobiaceae bacterium]|nr:SsrA-binding protein SmpB [Elusimicrobiaceae bacterium]
MSKKQAVLVVCSNRKAYHDYFIEDDYEAGLCLLGAEVKSVRQKEISLEGSFVRIENGQAYVYNMHIKPYRFNSLTELDPTRSRRLLLHKKELRKLSAKAEIKGYALVPLEVYLKNGWAKVKVAVAKGKHLVDKRESLKKRDLNREMEQNFKNKIRF